MIDHSCAQTGDAFDRAAKFCKAVVLRAPRIPGDVHDSVSEQNERDVFIPALELQLAGLYLVEGKSFEGSGARAISFACFGLDHLLWGGNLALDGQVRISFTLSRAAVEAFIFELAAVCIPDFFESKWNSRDSTGGFFLRRLSGLSPRVQGLLDAAWGHCVAFGHPSMWPVMGGAERIETSQGVIRGITFGGQHAGSLDSATLHHLVSVYSVAALSGVEAMNVAFGSLRTVGRWQEHYATLQRQLQQRVSMPTYLRELLDEELKSKGGIV